MNQLIPQHNHDDWYTIIDLVTNSVDSPHSKRAYSRALVDFMEWYEANGRPGLTKAIINIYRQSLLAEGKSRSSINQALSAIRKLAVEAGDNGLISPTAAAGIERVKGVKQEGIRAGNWLTREQAQQLVETPMHRYGRDEMTHEKALRDRAILAVMLGTGLRRSEVAALTWDHVQQRDGRWAIVDLVGKRGRIRTIGMPEWVKRALDEWARVGGGNGRVFKAVNMDGKLSGEVKTKGGHTADGNLTPQAIYKIVEEHTTSAGFPGLAAHDLRRTAAALALDGGADIRQIQQMLGHASITTTERYLEPMRSLRETAADFIQIEL